MVQTVQDLVSEDCQVSVRELADYLNIGKSIVHRMPTEDLGWHNVASVWIPHALSDQQKLSRVNCAKTYSTEKEW